MFPPEIVDHILSFLQWDRSTLETCAQVHPFISKLVERHLYTHLATSNRIDHYPDAHRPSELSKLIHDNPDIAKHACSLEIRLVEPEPKEYSKLDSILPILSVLKTIVLEVSVTSPWISLSESFRTVFANCLRLQTLTNLQVSVPAFPLSLLECSKSLRKLSLTWACDSTTSYAPPSLDTLASYYFSPEIMIQWTKKCSLRSLTFHRLPTGLAGLLEVCTDSLMTLKLQIPRDFNVQYGNGGSFVPIPISLSCLPHLTRLVIRFSIYCNPLGDDCESWEYDTCLPAIMHLLDTLPSPPAKLDLLISADIAPRLFNPPISFFDWSPLLSFSYFDAIPSIELRVCDRRTEMPLIDMLNTLKQDHYLMQLEKHRSFRLAVVEEPVDFEF